MAKYTSKFTGAEIDEKLSKVNQEYTSEEKNKLAALENYDDTDIVAAIGNLETNKVDKEEGKGLSTNDFTTEEKNKLAGLQNYDDTTISQAISDLETNKANSADVYTKEETYSKTETDNEITEKVAEIVAGAPEEFDTLKEMSDWLTEHEDSAAAMNSAIQQNTADIATNASGIASNTSAIQQNADDIANRYTKTEADEKFLGKTETAAAAVLDSAGGNIAEQFAAANENFSNYIPLANNAGAHNAIYRGKNLGTAVTDEQYAAIAAGTFDDLYIGDYWVIDGVNWRIAAFDYYYNCGDTVCTTHHAVIVPDTGLYTAQMNTSNVTTGGYVGSAMYTSNLEDAKTTIKAAFSGHVLSHRIYLTNDVTSGYASDGAWCDSEVDLMNENMVYGSAILRPHNSLGSTIPNSYTVEKSQLPLFQHEPSRISIRTSWWLRDVVSASRFSDIGYDGIAHYGDAGYARGVRPSFCIY